LIKDSKEATIQDLYDFGWQHKDGTGLVNYYYFPPDVMKSAVPRFAAGRYYTSESAALEFAKEEAAATYKEDD
jgi:hypothetical protein